MGRGGTCLARESNHDSLWTMRARSFKTRACARLASGLRRRGGPPRGTAGSLRGRRRGEPRAHPPGPSGAHGFPGPRSRDRGARRGGAHRGERRRSHALERGAALRVRAALDRPQAPSPRTTSRRWRSGCGARRCSRWRATPRSPSSRRRSGARRKTAPASGSSSRGRLTLRGRSFPVEVPLEVVREALGIAARGGLDLNLRDLGVEPPPWRASSRWPTASGSSSRLRARATVAREVTVTDAMPGRGPAASGGSARPKRRRRT